MGGFGLSIPVYVDAISLSFAASVIVISGAIMLFSVSYIGGEVHFVRFSALVLLFVIRIILLILSPRVIRVLLGWDGLGVTSFLLVVYYNSPKSLNAGIITALSNRVGDCLILLAIGIIASSGSLNLFLLPGFRGERALGAVTIILAVGATTKRAQVPFSAWLPAAMAAPTPVSALVHSSTLVTAGVYLLVRFGGGLGGAMGSYILAVGSLTIVIAGSAAIFETDIKKIVALSTLRQLGLIIAAVGMGLLNLAFFHLLTHAYFKALLFITVGNIIHLSRDHQDLRLISLRESPLGPTSRFRLVANFRLIGLPFLRGFYSKDLILELSLSGSLGGAEKFLFMLATLLTAAYSLRFITIILWSHDSSPSLK